MQVLIVLSALIVANCAVDVEKYLEKFGYHNSNTFDGGLLTESIKTFQRKFGLAPTGVADQQTTKLMNTPRCGMSDHQNNAFSTPKWQQNDLTYYFSNFTPDLTEDQVKSLTTSAFQYWSDVTPLTFTEKDGGDIVLAFGTKIHKDDRQMCSSPFDGKGGDLAHAFFPSDGRLHFDDDEDFTTKSPKGTNYLWVATHELGHILGLEHDTNNKQAVMYPYYRYNANGVALHPSDISRIQHRYGKNPHRTAPPFTLPPACYDEAANCDVWKKHCGSTSSYWKNFLKRICKQTCKLC